MEKNAMNYNVNIPNSSTSDMATCSFFGKIIRYPITKSFIFIQSIVSNDHPSKRHLTGASHRKTMAPNRSPCLGPSPPRPSNLRAQLASRSMVCTGRFRTRCRKERSEREIYKGGKGKVRGCERGGRDFGGICGESL
mmetsp:Transcript_14779/g.30992  ORF Transcript_14779/g.30992 Transcript_14779/m.30992 type:complete len:137 (-) Transcript_14779:363-773(-)